MKENQAENNRYLRLALFAVNAVKAEQNF
jgi:hypothetical protein